MSVGLSVTAAVAVCISLGQAPSGRPSLQRRLKKKEYEVEVLKGQLKKREREQKQRTATPTEVRRALGGGGGACPSGCVRHPHLITALVALRNILFALCGIYTSKRSDGFLGWSGDR